MKYDVEGSQEQKYWEGEGGWCLSCKKWRPYVGFGAKHIDGTTLK